jgi:hypothetical protein
MFSFPLARADVVADWNMIALHTIASSEQRPAQMAVEMAMVHVAMFETMNFIEGAYVPRFVVKPHQPLGLSGEAAAAAAAHYVLIQLHPEHKPALDAGLERSLVAIPDSQEKSSASVTGMALGANIYAIWAAESISARTDSGSAPKTPQARASTPGVGPSAVAWYGVAGQLIEAQGLRPIENARLYALVSMALSDVYRSERDAKGSELVCAPCAARTAIQVILQSESASAAASGERLTGTSALGAVSASSRVLRSAEGVSFEPVSGSDNRQVPIRAGEEIGRRIGLRTLAHYRPSR